MFKNIQEIKATVSKFNNDTVQIKRKRRWDEDFDLYRLKPYDAGKGYYSYSSNSPRLLADKGIALLNQARLIIRIPPEIFSLLSEGDRKISSDVERFLYGSFGLNDERLSLKGIPILRRQLSWYGVVRGSAFVKAFMNKDEKGETMPEIDVWDSYNVAYGQGKDGLLWATHTRPVTREQIEDEYNFNIGKDEGTVIDFWDTENNGIIVESKWGKKLTPHGLDYCPVCHIQAGSMPPVWQERYLYTDIHRGESIFAPTRGLYSLLNKSISDLLTLVRRGVKVPLGYWSADGTKTLDEDIYQVEKAAVVPMAEGDMIKPLITPSMPGDTKPLLDIISGEIQRGGFPHTVFGELGFRLSGFAINQLLAGIETVITPFEEAITQAYEVASIWLLKQFTAGGFKAIKVRGRTSKNEAFGVPQAERISPSQLKGDWHPEISLEPVLPRDDAQQVQLAKLLRSPDAYGEPLVSRRTTMDRLGIQDPDLEQQIIDSEWAGAIPLVKLQRMFDAQMAQGNFIEAQYTLMEIQQLLRTMGGTLPGQKGKATAPTGLEEASMGQVGVGVPPGETGLPSEVMPSEAMGGLPGGAGGAEMTPIGGI